jgi:hypothetical protein
MPPFADVLEWEHLPFPKSLPHFQRPSSRSVSRALRSRRATTSGPGSSLAAAVRRADLPPSGMRHDEMLKA